MDTPASVTLFPRSEGGMSRWLAPARQDSRCKWGELCRSPHKPVCEPSAMLIVGVYLPGVVEVLQSSGENFFIDLQLSHQTEFLYSRLRSRRKVIPSVRELTISRPADQKRVLPARVGLWINVSASRKVRRVQIPACANLNRAL